MRCISSPHPSLDGDFAPPNDCAPRLPSLSPLAGSIRPHTAACLIEEYISDKDRAAIRTRNLPLYQLLPSCFRVQAQQSRESFAGTPHYLTMSALARKGRVPMAEYGRKRSVRQVDHDLRRPVSQESGLSRMGGSRRSMASRLSLTGRQEPLIKSKRSRASTEARSGDVNGKGIADCLTYVSSRQQTAGSTGSRQSSRSSTNSKRFAWDAVANKKEPMEQGASTRRIRQQNHPMAGFRASKAQMFQVFTILDKDMTGKVTPSEFEEDCLSLGMSPEQVSKLWERIDWNKKGYIEYADWGRAETLPAVEKLTRLYLMTHMGLPTLASSADEVRKYNEKANAQKLRSVVAALEQLKRKLIQWRSRSLAGENPIFEAFKFVDVDGNGVLSADEFCQAFGALGVNVADKTLKEMLSIVDMDGNGLIDYYEFSKTLFPQL